VTSANFDEKRGGKLKKIFILFIVLSSLTFATERFDRLNWGDSAFQVKLTYPAAKEIKSESGITVLSSDYPEEDVDWYKFSFQNDKLYQIELKYDNNISFEDLESIYSDLVESYGISESKEVEYSEGGFNFIGNEKIWTQGDSLIILRGIDKYDSNDDIVESELYLIHRQLSALPNKK
jgi:hypothetical protein